MAYSAPEAVEPMADSNSSPAPENVSEAVNPHRRAPSTLTPEARERGRALAAETRKAQLAAWASNPPKQPPTAHLASFMKAILSHYGIRLPESEPATVSRLRQLLRRAGITQEMAQDAVGCRLGTYIRLNRDMALWWLVAATLESNNLEIAEQVLETMNEQ
jgi:hypothetical protein